MADQADLARDLLRLAADDLTAVEALADVPAVSDAIVGFHAQQAAEKALKAALASRGEDFPFTHNIAVLAQLCEDAQLTLPAALDGLDLLTPYGVAARYGAQVPGTVDRATAKQLASGAVAWARAVVESPASGR
jgi:HEPN domain-containing protein